LPGVCACVVDSWKACASSTSSRLSARDTCPVSGASPATIPLSQSISVPYTSKVSAL